MTRKHNLKLVQPSPVDELDAAIAAAAAAAERWRNAEADLAKKYPGDNRLFQVKAEWEPDRIAFFEERQAVAMLQREAQVAERAVDAARARVAATVTEREKRVTLVAAIDAAAKAAQSVETIRASVDRARAALSAAEAKLSEASVAEEGARKAKAGRLLEAIEADRPIESDATLRQARDAKIEASDDIAFASDALTAVETKLRNAEEGLRISRDQILICAKAVAASAIPRLLEEAAAMQRELEARRQVLSLLGDYDASGAGYGEAVNEYMESPVFPFEQARGAVDDHPAVARGLRPSTRWPATRKRRCRKTEFAARRVNSSGRRPRGFHLTRGAAIRGVPREITLESWQGCDLARWLAHSKGREAESAPLIVARRRGRNGGGQRLEMCQ